MLIVIGVLIVFIAALLFWKNFLTVSGLFTGGTKTQPPVTTTTGKNTTADLVDQAKNTPGAKTEVIERTDGAAGPEQKAAVVMVPNSNPIDVTTGEVLSRDGKTVAKQGGRAGDPDAVLQSSSIDPAKLPPGAVKLIVGATAITPAEFTVSPGQLVILGVTAADSPEIFKFDDPSLSAIAAGLTPNETIVLNFTAPTQPGEYVYYSDFINHRARGSVGKMIVK